jgi:pimeloyl-ACP methyl ester carboxylesterase
MLPEVGILAAQGYGVLAFDFRGHGTSDGALVTLGDHERRDLEAAIDFCASRPEVARTCGLGFSMGGATLAQVAATDQRLSAVVIVAAYPTLAQEIRYRARSLGPLSQLPALIAIRRASVDVRDVRPIDDLCAISPRPLLLIYGQIDADVPPGTAQNMIDAACAPSELWVVAGAGHQSMAGVIPRQYESRLVDFFR